MSTRFHFLNKIKLENRKLLKTHLSNLCIEENKELISLDFIFCSDDYLLQINRQYLHHDYHTDIITFSLDDSDNSKISGEIYISVDTVKANSMIYKVSVSNELHRVIFHGVLHLCGYGDKSKKEKERMTQKENDNLDTYFKYPR